MSSDQAFYTFSRKSALSSKEFAAKVSEEKQPTKMTNRWEGVERNSKPIKINIISYAVRLL